MEGSCYFRNIYHYPPRMTVDELLVVFQQLRSSQNQFQRDLFESMIHRLFTAYFNFGRYVERHLLISANLFGGLIEHDILGINLRCAMNRVLHTLHLPIDSKMFTFGITALERFKDSLHLYPRFCRIVRNIPSFSKFPPHLIEYIECYGYVQRPQNWPQKRWNDWQCCLLMSYWELAIIIKILIDNN